MNIPRAQLLLSAWALVAIGCQTPVGISSPQKSGPTHSASNVTAVKETEVMSAKEQLAWLQGRKNYLKSLYQERRDPYFGRADQGPACEAAAVKQLAEKSNGVASFVSYQILTTEAGAAGGCEPQMQTHRMALVFAACSSRPLQFTLKKICPLTGAAVPAECSIGEEQINSYCL
ncbi:MAG: hypothetical protein J0L82_09855 [Deltaproteobacteria bacterium]|jgi:hypothetical protein|nr:hypothetical protein [Deltaproteobacteria bacterium]